MPEYLTILKKLISIDSSTGTSNKEIVEYIASLFKKERRDFFDIKIQPVKKKDFEVFNLIVKVKGKSQDRPLIFSGHTDTVSAGQGWKTPPLKPVLKNSRLYGLGASDMKGAVSLMVYNLLNLRDLPSSDVYLILSSDEESAGQGAKKIVSFLNQKRIKSARTIIGESTSGKLRLGQKAVLSFEIKIVSRSAHASTLSLKENFRVNPIQRMLRVIEGLNNFSQKINVEKPGYGGVTFNVGTFNAGQGANSIPSQAVVKIDFRFPPSKKFENLEKLKANILKEIKKASPNAEVRLLFQGGFFETSPQNEFVLEIQSIAQKLFKKKLETYVSTPWTEASIYKQFGDVVILGPGKVGQPHAENEYIELTILEKVSKVYSSILKAL